MQNLLSIQNINLQNLQKVNLLVWTPYLSMNPTIVSVLGVAMEFTIYSDSPPPISFKMVANKGVIDT